MTISTALCSCGRRPAVTPDLNRCNLDAIPEDASAKLLLKTWAIRVGQEHQMTSLAATTTCFPNICTPKFQLCSHPGLGRRVICQTFSSPTTKVLRDVPLESISGSAELTRSLGRAQPERSVHHEIDGAANLARNQFIHGGIDGR